MRPVEHKELVRARTAFWSGMAGGLAGAVAIHLIASHVSVDETLRLGLVVLFFTCLATATWSFTTPFREYHSRGLALALLRSGAGDSVQRRALRLATHPVLHIPRLDFNRSNRSLPPVGPELLGSGPAACGIA